MKLKFLCDGHRTFLTNNPEHALETCLSCSDQGTKLLREHRYVDAVPYFGNAFEAAAIVLESGSLHVGAALDWFLASASGLTEALALLEKRAEAKEVCLTTRDQLRRELPRAHGRRIQIMQQLAWVETMLRQLQAAPASGVSHGAIQPISDSNVYLHPAASRAVH
jgi:hypothetical protein